MTFGPVGRLAFTMSAVLLAAWTFTAAAPHRRPARDEATPLLVAPPAPVPGAAAALSSWKSAQTAREGGTPSDWWLWGLVAVDLDQDGDDDLIVQHHSTLGGMVLRNLRVERGSPSVRDDTAAFGIDASSLPIAEKKIRVWDFDKDGWPDLGGFSSSYTAASLWNRGGSRLERAAWSFSPISKPRVMDLDGDGYLDVTNGRLDFLYDPAARTFHQRPSVQPALPEEIRAEIASLKSLPENRFFQCATETGVDLNNDGRPDLIVACFSSYSGSKVSYYLERRADGSVVDRRTSWGLPREGTFVAADGPARPLLLVTRGAGSGLYAPDGSQYRRIENAELTALLRQDDPYQQEAWWVDLDKDGRLDLVVSSPRLGVVEAYQRVSAVTLERRLRATDLWDSEPLALTDVDGDGFLDIAVGKGDDIVWYRTRPGQVR